MRKINFKNKTIFQGIERLGRIFQMKFF